MDLLTFARRKFPAVTCCVTPVTMLSKRCIMVDFFFSISLLSCLLTRFPSFITDADAGVTAVKGLVWSGLTRVNR